MQSFNPHKPQLIAAIQDQITRTDRQCALLSRDLQEYSQERTNELERRCTVLRSEVEAGRSRRKEEGKKEAQLNSTLEWLRAEQLQLQSELRLKQQASESMQRQLMFLEQKAREEGPHVQSYLRQRELSTRAGQEVRYVRNKLRQLEERYQSKCSEVQYKYRLVELLKKKRAQMRGNLGNPDDYQRLAEECSVLAGTGKHWELSTKRESVMSSFRE